MILDANILIALFDDQDSHHQQAVDVVADAVGVIAVHEVTAAEALVLPARAGRAEQAMEAMTAMGIERATGNSDFSVRLAAVRAESGLKMPDAIVLAVAQQEGGAVATLDRRLANVAKERGMVVLPHG